MGGGDFDGVIIYYYCKGVRGLRLGIPYVYIYKVLSTQYHILSNDFPVIPKHQESSCENLYPSKTLSFAITAMLDLAGTIT